MLFVQLYLGISFIYWRNPSNAQNPSQSPLNRVKVVDSAQDHMFHIPDYEDKHKAKRNGYTAASQYWNPDAIRKSVSIWLLR